MSCFSREPMSTDSKHSNNSSRCQNVQEGWRPRAGEVKASLRADKPMNPAYDTAEMSFGALPGRGRAHHVPACRRRGSALGFRLLSLERRRRWCSAW